MAKKLTTVEDAKIAGEALKKLFKFGTKNKPAWFGNVSVGMQQDGSYDLSICIPSWSAITDKDREDIPDEINGVHIGMRVVTPPPVYVYQKTDKEEKALAKKEKKAKEAIKIAEKVAEKAATKEAKKEKALAKIVEAEEKKEELNVEPEKVE